MAFYSFDVIGPAMNWSGLHADTFAPDQYTAFLLAYKNAYHGPLTCNPELGFWTAMGWGFAWLTHNFRRLNKPNLPPDDIAKHQNASDKVIRVLKSSSIHRNHLTQIQ